MKISKKEIKEIVNEILSEDKKANQLKLIIKNHKILTNDPDGEGYYEEYDEEMAEWLDDDNWEKSINFKDFQTHDYANIFYIQMKVADNYDLKVKNK